MKNWLLHPTGGLVWHMRAQIHRRRWQPLLDIVSVWLQQWQPPSSKLILLGPSAGWTLPPDFLPRFEHITAIEPDPLARWLLCRRFATARIDFDRLDITRTGQLSALLQRYPDHALLFCNVLGQIGPADDGSWCHSLRETLRHRHWASYHELISTRHVPQNQNTLELNGDMPLDEMIRCFWQHPYLEVNDHATHPLGQHKQTSLLPWQLTRNDWHLLQWVQHTPSAP